ncbi:hypothetical protein GUJ93_ZPchr0010g7368 [Zizania palustris]|uniref:Uncharacterized protein n=1 Tax=Zizania palustris TaxID=103762 RepID=A0A8J6BII3_ZIZPA|nr:hypothetical protein GUJ93_ZPchr0010g7368 [Zizania palustris]
MAWLADRIEGWRRRVLGRWRGFGGGGAACGGRQMGFEGGDTACKREAEGAPEGLGATHARPSLSSSSDNRAPPAPSHGCRSGSHRPRHTSTFPRPRSHPTSSIDRIVHRLHNLGLTTDDDDPTTATVTAPPNGNERLGDLLDCSWAHLDHHFATSSFDEEVIPW